MRKSITLLVVLAIFATSAFAASVSGTEVSGDQTGTALFSAVDESDSLFANVGAVALTEAEASEIEGEGLFGALWGAIVGAVVGAATGGSTGAAAGAVAGGIVGACLPF
jgi:outer membrane lipoprotein SlyB